MNFPEARKTLLDALQKSHIGSLHPLNVEVTTRGFKVTWPQSKWVFGTDEQVVETAQFNEDCLQHLAVYNPPLQRGRFCVQTSYKSMLKSRLIMEWLSLDDARRFVDSVNHIIFYLSSRPLTDDDPAFADFQQKAKSWRALSSKAPLPESIQPLQAAAEDAFHAKSYDQAVDYFEQGLAIEPLWPAGHFGAAQVYGKLGVYSLAALHMKRYLELEPDAKDAKNCRTQMFVWTQKAKNPASATSADVSSEDATLTVVPESSFEGAPFEKLLASKDAAPGEARARNVALLNAKNQSLPSLLRDKKNADLAALTTRVEQVILDLNHESETSKDRAQQVVERGSGGANQVAEMRELAVAYKERIEILKPILAAIKEETANRNK